MRRHTRTRVDDQPGYDRWELDSALALGFRAAGFRQIFRRAPLHVERQRLTLEERGGLSFAEDAYDGASTLLAATHAENPPAEIRIEEPTEDEQVERLRRPRATSGGSSSGSFAHMRLWALVYELRRAQLGGDTPADAGARDDAHLASAEYRALSSEPKQLAIDRDQMLLTVRDDARVRAIEPARSRIRARGGGDPAPDRPARPLSPLLEEVSNPRAEGRGRGMPPSGKALRVVNLARLCAWMLGLGGEPGKCLTRTNY